MTRIISGFAGSIRLSVPASGTRPTSDRVREAIFSALEARNAIDGCRVLDLYAGSGSLGLEAASRGASAVTLVDRSPQAAAACRRNAALVQKAAPRGSEFAVETASQSANAFLASSGATWDLVFIDPPYELAIEADLALLQPRLSPDAIIVLERSSRDAQPEWPAGIELEKRKVYGDTALYWLRPSVDDQPTPPSHSS